MNIVDRNGRLIESWEQHNKLFVRPHRIIVSPYDPDRHVWLVDDGAHALYKFTRDGKQLVQTIGTPRVPGNDETHFARPTDIAFLPDGTFFVSDGYTNTRVVKFDRNGKYVTSWGMRGEAGKETRPYYMNTVHAIVADKQRRLYVSDRANHRIQIFDENGKFLEHWQNVPLPYSLMMTDDQFLWSASGQTMKFTKYDLNGKAAGGVGHVRRDAGRLLGRASVPRGQRGEPVHCGRARRTAAEVPAAAGRRPQPPHRRANTRGQCHVDALDAATPHDQLPTHETSGGGSCLCTQAVRGRHVFRGSVAMRVCSMRQRIQHDVRRQRVARLLSENCADSGQGVEFIGDSVGDVAGCAARVAGSGATRRDCFCARGEPCAQSATGPAAVALDDGQRRRLAVLGQRLGRGLLRQFATLVTPDTILRWHCDLVARKWTYCAATVWPTGCTAGHPAPGGADGHRQSAVGLHAHPRCAEEPRASGRPVDHREHSESRRHATVR